MEYIVIEVVEDLDIFELEVSDRLAKGWELYGNLVVTPCELDEDDEPYMGLIYHQALVKKEE